MHKREFKVGDWVQHTGGSPSPEWKDQICQVIGAPVPSEVFPNEINVPIEWAFPKPPVEMKRSTAFARNLRHIGSPNGR
jgi:hypothetical protein